jgi:hypothetical protein
MKGCPQRRLGPLGRLFITGMSGRFLSPSAVSIAEPPERTPQVGRGVRKRSVRNTCPVIIPANGVSISVPYASRHTTAWVDERQDHNRWGCDGTLGGFRHRNGDPTFPQTRLLRDEASRPDRVLAARVSDAAPSAEIEFIRSCGTTGSPVRAPAVPPASSSCFPADGQLISGPDRVPGTR